MTEHAEEHSAGPASFDGGKPSRTLRRAARQAVSELRWVQKKHGRGLSPALNEKLDRLRRRLGAALAAADAAQIEIAYAEAADCLEHEAAPFRKSVAREYFEVIALALALAVFSRTFIIQAFKIPSGSMIPTLLVGDYLLVSKLSYGIKKPFEGWFVQWDEPECGDIIVFITPEDRTRSVIDQRDFIKRVIAVGGETVEVRERRIFVNGEEVPDPWGYYESGPAFDRPDYGPVTVPEGKLFVMGDNRNDSLDSRVWGFVPMDLVVGKAKILYFSADSRPFDIRWDRIGRFIH